MSPDGPAVVARGHGWQAPGELADLLEDVAEFVRRYVVMTPPQADAAALWIAHTHVFEASEISPYLAITSAEMRSGKTTLMKMLRLLAARPWSVITPSEAVVYRKIERDRPTLLLDEYDTIFGSKREYEPLRALLNAGNEPGTVVPRVGGANRDKLEDFGVFCPKALAGIGKLPPTVSDRSIRIVLKRKAPHERADKMRIRRVKEWAKPFHERLVGWGAESVDGLAEAEPNVPDELDDRAQDAWEILIAVADLAGGSWPERARKAALDLSGNAAREEDESEGMGIRLLRDTRTIFDRTGAEELVTSALIAELGLLEESPWGDWYGKSITPQKLSGLLRPFGIGRTKQIWTDGRNLKGYGREQFGDAWLRYLPAEVARPARPARPRVASEAAPSDPSASSDSDGVGMENEQAILTEVAELEEAGVLVPLDVDTPTKEEA